MAALAGFLGEILDMFSIVFYFATRMGQPDSGQLLRKTQFLHSNFW